MKPEVHPVYAVVDYTWALLKLNTEMKESDYGGRVPIVPASVQPEFANQTKPFLIYGFTENPTYDPYAIRGGQVAFAIYASTDREIARIENILALAFGQFDESAADVNDWATGGIFQDMHFTTISFGIIEGPSPEDQEGGRKSGVVMLRFECIPTYTINKP